MHKWDLFPWRSPDSPEPPDIHHEATTVRMFERRFGLRSLSSRDLGWNPAEGCSVSVTGGLELCGLAAAAQ